MPQPARDPREVIRAAAAREQSIRTLRARFRVRVGNGGEARSATGVLVVRKPDAFRMRLFGPLGWTVFDYLERDGLAWVTHPARAEGDQASSKALAFLSREGLGAVFLDQRAFAAEDCTLSAETAECGDTGARARIDLSRGVVIEESRSSEHAAVEVTYAEYRERDGVLLPFEIRIEDRVRGVEVAVDVEAYDVNPVLGEELFEPTGAR